MPREGKKSPSSQALALLYLRSRRDWSQRELADRLGWTDEKQVSRYERGGRPLSRKTLETAAEVVYYRAIERLANPSLLERATQILGCEAQHWSGLSLLLHYHDPGLAVPHAFAPLVGQFSP